MEERTFPDQFSMPVRKVLSAMSIGVPNLVGSGADHRMMYAADYDMIEKVVASAPSVRKFQGLVKKASKYGKITDIKCGEVSEWNLLSKVRLSGRKVVGYNHQEELAHLRELWQKKIVTHDEFMNMETLLKPTLTILESIHARKEGRFGILRWTPKDVNEGHLKLRDGKVMYLSEAIKTRGITKVDLIAWIQDKYVEVSNILIFTNRSGKPLPKLNNLKESLSENLLAYEVDGNYIKVAKRMFAIAKLRHDTETIETLLDILNSQLGSLYLVTADLEVLQDFPSAINSSRKRLELDLMRDRFAKLFYPQFNKAVPSLALLPVLQEVLQRETKKALEEEGLLPIPKDYLP
jgi:hypothetical protein